MLRRQLVDIGGLGHGARVHNEEEDYDNEGGGVAAISHLNQHRQSLKVQQTLHSPPVLVAEVVSAPLSPLKYRQYLQFMLATSFPLALVATSLIQTLLISPTSVPVTTL